MIAIVPIVPPAIAPIVIDVCPVVVTIVDPVVPIVDLPRMMIGPSVAAGTIRWTVLAAASLARTVGSVIATAIAAAPGTIATTAGTLFAAAALSRTTGPFVAATAGAQLTAAARARPSSASYIPGAGTTGQRARPVAAADPFAAGRTIAEKIRGCAASQRAARNRARVR